MRAWPCGPATTISSAANGSRPSPATISTISARSPARRSARSPARKPPTSSWRSTPPIRPRTPGATWRRPSAPRSSTRSPTAWRRTSRCWPRSRPSTTASRSARPPSPTSRSPSIISAISPRACAPRKARCRRSITTPSPITITSRSAWSARSSRGTSRS